MSLARQGSKPAGHTLIELIVALFISVSVIAAVMSLFLMLGRSSVSLANYGEMAIGSGQALEHLAQDLRMASDVAWNSDTSITLTVPDYYGATSNRVTYAYDTDSSSPTYQCFYAMPGSAGDSNPKRILMRDVTALNFARFNRLDALTASDAETKRIQLSFTATEAQVTLATATNSIVSASFVLRNKPAN